MKTKTRTVTILLLSTLSLLNACAKSDDGTTTQTTSTAVTCSGSTLTGNYTSAINVPAGATCNFSGLVVVKSGGSLTIGAGAKMVGNPGQSPASSIIIDTGATINANGWRD